MQPAYIQPNIYIVSSTYKGKEEKRFFVPRRATGCPAKRVSAHVYLYVAPLILCVGPLELLWYTRRFQAAACRRVLLAAAAAAETPKSRSGTPKRKKNKVTKKYNALPLLLYQHNSIRSLLILENIVVIPNDQNEELNPKGKTCFLKIHVQYIFFMYHCCCHHPIVIFFIEKTRNRQAQHHPLTQKI